jgi:hypothetical protein
MSSKAAKQQFGEEYDSEGFPVCDDTEPEECWHQPVPEPFDDKAKDQSEQGSKAEPHHCQAYNPDDFRSSLRGRPMEVMKMIVIHGFFSFL